MKINMNDSSINTIEDIREFLNTSEKISFERESSEPVYKWMQCLLVKFRYIQLNKPGKGLVKKYIEKLTGYSRAQVTRLIRQYVKTGYINLNTNSVKRYNRENVRKNDGFHGLGLKSIIFISFH